ncbi:MAG TPA: hypothetical protein PLG93_00655, partial [bacterium]|nr:hypothetical protein [bacterium]HOR57202.1 hypothetical protein [bacterium]
QIDNQSGQGFSPWHHNERQGKRGWNRTSVVSSPSVISCLQQIDNQSGQGFSPWHHNERNLYIAQKRFFYGAPANYYYIA